MDGPVGGDVLDSREDVVEKLPMKNAAVVATIASSPMSATMRPVALFIVAAFHSGYRT
jgi:hypothetical protein